MKTSIKARLAELKKEHKRATMSKTHAASWYNKRIIDELISDDFDHNQAHKEGYRYCEYCERIYLADYEIDFISESLTDDLDEATLEGLDWCCCYCKEMAKIMSEPKSDGSDVYLTPYPEYAKRRLVEMANQSTNQTEETS